MKTLTVDGADFAYNGGPPVLRSVTIEARPGQILAVTGTSGASSPAYLASPLVAGSTMTVYGCAPSATLSSAPVTVTMCGAFQFALVKVKLAGLTVPSAVLLLCTGMTTSAVGWELRAMVKVALPPPLHFFASYGDVSREPRG